VEGGRVRFWLCLPRRGTLCRHTLAGPITGQMALLLAGGRNSVTHVGLT